jgi:hypothetical protein
MCEGLSCESFIHGTHNNPAQLTIAIPILLRKEWELILPKMHS